MQISFLTYAHARTTQCCSHQEKIHSCLVSFPTNDGPPRHDRCPVEDLSLLRCGSAPCPCGAKFYVGAQASVCYKAYVALALALANHKRATAKTTLSADQSGGH